MKLKKSLFRLVAVLVVVVMSLSFGLMACGDDVSGTTTLKKYLEKELKIGIYEEMAQEAYDRTIENAATLPTTVKTTAEINAWDNLNSGVTFNMGVFHDNKSYITYTNGEGISGNYIAADGVEYQTGDITPVWKQLAEDLNFTIQDTAYGGGYKNQEAQWDAVQSNDFTGTVKGSTQQLDIDIITANGDDIFQEQSASGGTRFVNLADYLEYMPNFTNFLKTNSVVVNTITASDKGIYYAPYFDGYDDIERMFIVRHDWVEKLLNGTLQETNGAFDGEIKTTTGSARTFDTIKSLNSAYTPFLSETFDGTVTVVKADGSGTETVNKSYDKNIITIQNELTVKNGKTLAKALIDYIDSTYTKADGTPYYTADNRADLFIGQNAAYNTDELVALLRVVLTNAKLLTGSASTVIVPIYPRESTSQRLEDLVRLCSLFGARGLESRNASFYLDNEGKIHDARLQDSTYEAIQKLHELYQEELILQNYMTPTATTKIDYRAELNNSNRGFLIYDYNQTTVAYNTTSGVSGMRLAPIIPPYTAWDWDFDGEGDEELTRFTESWRSVKPNGWAIIDNGDQAKIKRAVRLFDYLYSEEGNTLMSYGPDEWIEHDAQGNMVTIEYNGKQVPKLSVKVTGTNPNGTTLEEKGELAYYAKSNYTNYYRRFLGGTFPIGYVKEQGMEYQCTNQYGNEGLDNILTAISEGTVKHLVVNTSAETNKALHLVPSTLAFTDEDQQYITNDLSRMDETFEASSSIYTHFWSNYIIYGFGYKGASATTYSK